MLLQDAESYGLERILLLLLTQHAAKVPQYGGTLFPKLEHHAQALLGHEHPGYARSSHSAGGMAQASLDDDEDWEEAFQTPHTPVCRVVRREEGGQGKPAAKQMEASRGSPAWRLFAQVDISEEEPKTLEDIDPHWRAQWWLQVATQGIRDEEVLWHELLTLLTSGAEGVAKSLAKCLVAAWQWNVKVQGEGVCPPTPSTLNISQFLTDEEAEGAMGEPHWFVAYSCMLQWVGEVARRRKWEARREALEIKASLLVHTFWHKTDIDLMIVSVKHCWKPAPRTLHHQRENGPTAHIISYLNELAVCVPTIEAWDQMVWPSTVAIMRVPTEAESYGYCQGQVVDISPVMPAAQIHVTEERGTYLCTTRALVFKGSILMYNPTLNEAKWVPVHRLANNLSWAKERSAVALANYVPRAP